MEETAEGAGEARAVVAPLPFFVAAAAAFFLVADAALFRSRGATLGVRSSNGASLRLLRFFARGTEEARGEDGEETKPERGEATPWGDDDA
mmetsp:Transcript_3553/g.6193  ORF Transcript_3553/g.6193 Transcript_3553/m.6193 type:complete len:91 (+) Transcript_3553:531-803(+)